MSNPASPANPYQAPGSFAKPKDVNNVGLLAFVLSLIGLFLTCGSLNILSLPLSLIALAWKPRGFAIAGTVISVLGVAFLSVVGYGIVLGVLGLKEVASEMDKMLQTSAQVAQASTEIEKYRSENNKLPDGIEGNKLVVEKKDGWGESLRYDLNEAEGSYLIRSAGPDKQFDTPDDITSDTKTFDTDELDINFGPDDGMPNDGPLVMPPSDEK